MLPPPPPRKVHTHTLSTHISLYAVVKVLKTVETVQQHAAQHIKTALFFPDDEIRRKPCGCFKNDNK